MSDQMIVSNLRLGLIFDQRISAVRGGEVELCLTYGQAPDPVRTGTVGRRVFWQKRPYFSIILCVLRGDSFNSFFLLRTI